MMALGLMGLPRSVREIDVAVVGRVEWLAVSDGGGGVFVEEEVDRGQRAAAFGWVGSGGAGHGEQCVGASLRFGAAQLGDVDVAVTETGDGFFPVGVEFSVDVPAEDFEELGAADVVEEGVEAPRAVRVLQDAGGAASTVAFEFLGGAVGVGEHFPGEGSSFELDVGQVHGVDHQLPDSAHQDVGFDAGVGGDACHQSGLGDADLAGGECVVPHGHGAA